jgi:hypothetical protein
MISTGEFVHMLDATKNAQPIAQSQQAAPPLRKVLIMEHSDRMAGAIPAWRLPDSARSGVAGNLSEAGNPRSNGLDGAMAYTAQNNGVGEDEEFGFGDILDMVNPLQHIPIVNRIYRHITGDRIKPVAQVVGDTVYGGPIGGAASLTNVIIAHETGRDIAGNVLALAQGKEIRYRSVPDKPEQRLEVAARGAGPDNSLKDLPGTTLAFADMGGPGESYRRYEAVDDRAAARAVRTGKPESPAHAAPAPVSRGAFQSLHLND